MTQEMSHSHMDQRTRFSRIIAYKYIYIYIYTHRGCILPAHIGVSSEAICLCFDLDLSLLPYFVYARNECSADKTVNMRMLVCLRCTSIQ